MQPSGHDRYRTDAVNMSQTKDFLKLKAYYATSITRQISPDGSADCTGYLCQSILSISSISREQQRSESPLC